ncbi:MAG: T9SS type A sorting domain-containing protein [Bacteroidales bacterium]|nr:T9SS type A sorting domain-containing protein [Bacteroidales bacterium]
MRNIVFFILLLTVSVALRAQAAFGIVGGEVSGEDGSVSYSLGQIAVETTYARVTNASRVAANLREGVQQTYSVDELAIDAIDARGFDISVFPNPTTDMVIVKSSITNPNMRFELYGVDGRLMQNGLISQPEQNIDMQDCAAGAYILRIAVGKKENNYRIVKQ